MQGDLPAIELVDGESSWALAAFFTESERCFFCVGSSRLNSTVEGVLSSESVKLGSSSPPTLESTGRLPGSTDNRGGKPSAVRNL